MPNGRSGGFLLRKEDFERLLGDLSREVEIGRIHDKAITADHLRQLLDKHKLSEVPDI
jgi:hypothetical protein